jgi:hypothetical protein
MAIPASALPIGRLISLRAFLASFEVRRGDHGVATLSEGNEFCVT